MIDNLENTGVDNTQEISEEAAVSQESAETSSLEQFLNDAAAGEADAQTPDSNEQAEQTDAIDDAFDSNKGIKGRIQAERSKADRQGYERGRAEALREFEKQKADYEARLAKFAEMELATEAQQLANTEHISIELAKRILRAEKGNVGSTPAPAQPTVQQPASQQSDVEQYARMLYAQAQDIQKQYGFDVMDYYNSNADVKQKVNSREWDFKDVALFAMRQAPTTEQKKPTPAPVRSGAPRASKAGGLDFATMSDEDFDKFNAKVSRGERYTPR